MMKKLLLIVVLSIVLRPAFPLMDYAVNYDYIRKELCVNRDKTVMGCNGKCYLMKQLAAASESEKPASTDKKHHGFEKTDLFFYFETSKTEQQLTRSFHAPDLFHEALWGIPAAESLLRPPIVS